MSVTFEAMLVLEGSESFAITQLNDRLEFVDLQRRQQFEPINMDAAGGTKFWTMCTPPASITCHRATSPMGLAA